MRAIYKPIHLAVAAVVFMAGLLNVLTALALHHIPHIRLFEGILPVFFLHTARTFTLLSGLLLIGLSFNLSRRKKRAWSITTGVIVFSIVMHFIRGINIPEIVFLSVLLAVLILTRHVFEVQSGKSNLPGAFLRFLSVLVFLFIYSFFGFYLFQGQFSSPVTIPNIIADYAFSISGIGQEVLIPQTRNAHWFADSIAIVSAASIIYAFLSLFQPLIENDKTTEEKKKKIRDIFFAYGQNAVSYFSLMDDKQYFYDESAGAVLAYTVKNGFAVVLGEPAAANPAVLKGFTEKFIDRNKKLDLKTVFFNTNPGSIPFFKSLGFQAVKIGEEADIPVRDFTLEGAGMANIRHAYNKIKRKGVIFEWFRMDEIPWRYVDAVDRLHEGWVKAKKSPRLAFSLDFFPFPIEKEAYVLTAAMPGTGLLAAFSFFPYRNGQAMTLDFMVRSPSAPNGIVEAGIAEAVAFFREHQAETLSLGTAALADITPQLENRASGRIKNLIFDQFNRFYQYKSLFSFKKKFSPVWVHKYLVYKGNLNLASVLVAVMQAHLQEPFNLLSMFR